MCPECRSSLKDDGATRSKFHNETCSRARFKIVRMYRAFDRPSTPVRGKSDLTLSEAQAHCKDPGSRKDGVWFDGYTQTK